jgi:predicted membrane chloride channel (bestrophin family)
MALIPHTLLGAALSLLLVFRTNSAYARFVGEQQWWAGRQQGTASALCKQQINVACPSSLDDPTYCSCAELAVCPQRGATCGGLLCVTAVTGLALL